MTFHEQVSWNLTHESPSSNIEFKNTICEICLLDCKTPYDLYSHYNSNHPTLELIALYESKKLLPTNGYTQVHQND